MMGAMRLPWLGPALLAALCGCSRPGPPGQSEDRRRGGGGGAGEAGRRHPAHDAVRGDLHRAGGLDHRHPGTGHRAGGARRRSRLALVDVTARDAGRRGGGGLGGLPARSPLAAQGRHPDADKDGWQDQRTYSYQTSPNERRDVVAGAKRHGDDWTVWIYDMFQPTGERRAGPGGADLRAACCPEGTSGRPSPVARRRPLDQARIAGARAPSSNAGARRWGSRAWRWACSRTARWCFAGGFGSRELGKKTPVDANTLFIIASNTKAHDHADAGQARRREEADLGDPRHAGVSGLQARRRRHHQPRARQTPDLRLHRLAPPGLRMVPRVQVA